ncbi:MAG: phosphoenolpyruvate--protein phosphotransferase, partial [Chloroflexi bacterium]|nr:phosphoenolpyruvate--protein phosphotransferase [Chloroflexota bacterium]
SYLSCQRPAMDKSKVLAFCTAGGGPTSHTAILAKAMGLPAVVGLGERLLEIPSGTQVLVDGTNGVVIANPTRADLQAFGSQRDQAKRLSQEELAHAVEPASTRDGKQVEVVANVGGAAEAASALNLGAEGIGLLRTEFLYLERDTAPDEEEQYAAYCAVLDAMETRPVVVRTLDVGGDKQLAYLDLGKEANPFLGWRAIRMCLDRPDFFKVQLRALLRSSPGHNLRIMLPMISTLDEVHQSRKLLAEARQEVEALGFQVAGSIQLGIMVEIPSVAVMADRFASQVDFFSIGTNDLTQYTFAAERTNEKVAHLGDAIHPAILRQINQVIDAAHASRIWVGVCGELAGDPQAIPILLGLGLDEFSMAPASIPHAKAVLRSWTYEQARLLAHRAMSLDSAQAVRKLVHEWDL